MPKTTAQLEQLRQRRAEKLTTVELDVAELTMSPESRERVINSAAAEAGRCLAAGRDVLVMTSRALVRADDGIASLKIGNEVAASLVALVHKIEGRPRYMIAKGGSPRPTPQAWG